MSQKSVPLVLFFHLVKHKAQSTLLPYEPCKASALLFFILRSFLDWTELFQIRWHEIQILSKCWVFFLSDGDFFLDLEIVPEDNSSFCFRNQRISRWLEEFFILDIQILIFHFNIFPLFLLSVFWSSRKLL